MLIMTTVGSIIGVLLASLMALVQFTDLAPLMILVGMGITQFVIGNIIQPMMAGRSLNIGPFPHHPRIDLLECDHCLAGRAAQCSADGGHHDCL